MRRIRIYHAGNLASNITVMLESNASHHLLQVLRKKIGERFWIFNGCGGEFEVQLISIQKKTACVSVGDFHERQTESPLSIHLGQIISRGERMDYTVQKSTELGVTDITPIVSEFCQVPLSDHRVEKRITHWQAIATSAAEQSGRCAVPIIHPIKSFQEWVKMQESALKIICHPHCEKNKLQNDTISAKKNLLLTIGAEGGFSEREIQLALSENFYTLSLGPRVLRTETAAVVALTILQSRFGDLPH